MFIRPIRQTTITAGDLNLVMHRIYNGLGQLVETRDAKNGYTRYAYDGAGNPIVIQDPNTNSITAQYNDLGQKDWVDDPNMGLRSFTYNALGEVLTETDAVGNLISMDYDELGRMTERRVDEPNDDEHWVGRWHYDNPSNHKGLGLLDYEENNAQTDGTYLRKDYYYGGAASGHKKLISVAHELQGVGVTLPNELNTHYFYDAHYGRQKGMQYPGGFVLEQQYNNSGYLSHEIGYQPGQAATVFREITARDTRNQITAGYMSNGLLNYTAGYSYATGQVNSLTVDSASGSVANLSYLYDSYGNLDHQTTGVGSFVSVESFDYDELHRLTRSTRYVSGGKADVINYAYDPSGNLMLKDDYASQYYYDGTRPNAVSSVALIDGGQHVFNYDNNGNLETNGAGRTTQYNAFNKPILISNTTSTATFSYGADLSRYRQHSTTAGTKIYIGKHFEVDHQGAQTKYIHYISDVAVLTKLDNLTSTTFDVRYLHKDRLGSTVAITDETGAVVEARGHDPFGKPRHGDWSDRIPPLLNDIYVSIEITDRGFTDHEHLDDFQMIHMNGRIYDYNLGRFYSVDPYIVDPADGQAINAYSYIMNNPLSGTDPSGYQAVKETPGVGSNIPGQSGVQARNVSTNNGAKGTASNKSDSGGQENTKLETQTPSSNSNNPVMNGLQAAAGANKEFFETIESVGRSFENDPITALVDTLTAISDVIYYFPDLLVLEPLGVSVGSRQRIDAGVDEAVRNLDAASQAGEYTEIGAAGMAVWMAVRTKSKSTGTGGTTIYRAVGPNEVLDIPTNGNRYRTVEGGAEGKYFFDTPAQASNYARLQGDKAYTTTSVNVSLAELTRGTRINPAREGPGYFFETSDVPTGPVTIFDHSVLP